MKKKKLLAWSDSAIAGTGFGVVSKHVLTALHRTGKYDIHHLAINFRGQFTNPEEIPWQQQPAKLMDPKDPHGMKMFLKTLAEGDYDLVWICNDLYVTHEITEGLQQAKQVLAQRRKKWPQIVYYYPVDCCVPSDGSSFLKEAHIPVCYTDHGREETLKVFPAIEPKLRQIPHGADTKIFYPVAEEVVPQLKKGLRQDPDAPLIINVNRNSPRKQLQYSFLAFKEFKKQVPNAVMYVHAKVLDIGGDLKKAIQKLDLSPQSDIIYPLNYAATKPITPQAMNQLYNAADMFLTTHLGEGWGLTITEAMAAGTPVVAPRNTSMPQQLGENSERGYLYDCNDTIWIDSSGYRPKGLIPDIVEKMLEAYNDGKKFNNPKVHAAREWAVQHDWWEVAKQWVQLFDEIQSGNRLVVPRQSSNNLSVSEV